MAAQFAAVSGIYHASAEGYGGDNNNITVQFQGDGIVARYRNGCGDCPAGCTYSTTWTFKVFTNTDCRVEYLGRIPNADGETAYQRVCTRGTVLPISFVDVYGSIKNGKAILEWKVAGEENLAKYDVEDSPNGIDFTTVGSVKPTTGSAATKTYTWQGKDEVNVARYYRIKSVSINGGATYSKIIKLGLSAGTLSINVKPNPIQGNKINIEINNAKGAYSVAVYNMQGVTIFTRTESVTANAHSTVINLPASTPKGSYQLVLQNSGQLVKKVIVVQ
ncbi:MAG: type sorting protein [Segetibacter sp.]|nr:type sorting protein [Segetibacter sp.]